MRQPITITSLTLIAAAILIAGCLPATTPTSNRPVNVTAQTANAVMLKVASTGGLCPYGLCRSETVITENGSYTYTGGSVMQKTGAFSPEEVATLRRLIDQADFAVIKAKPFTGICPTAYDGQEMTYTFSPSQEVIASCTTAIDAQHQLFAHISNLLAKVYPQE